MPETWQEKKGGNMTECKSRNLPRFRSLDELVKFFDTHDMGEYWAAMPEAHFEVDIKRKTHLFALDTELANTLIEIAKNREISSETLINAWLKEKIQEQI
ncbi:MAG: CopG family antitoxin [Halobacteriota archaeon]